MQTQPLFEMADQQGNPVGAGVEIARMLVAYLSRAFWIESHASISRDK